MFITIRYVLGVCIFFLSMFISALSYVSPFVYAGNMAASKFNLANPAEGERNFFSVFIYQSQRRTLVDLAMITCPPLRGVIVDYN